MSNVIQLDWSREMTLHLSIGSKLSILQLYISVKIAWVYYNYLKLSKVALLQTLKIACSLTKGKLLYTLVYFTENTVMVSFHCTHYLISIFFFRSFKFKAPKFHLRSRKWAIVIPGILILSRCWPYTSPLLVSWETRLIFYLKFYLNFIIMPPRSNAWIRPVLLNSLKRKCFLGLVLNSFTRISSKF